MVSRLPIDGYTWMIYMRYFVTKNRKKRPVFCARFEVAVSLAKRKQRNHKWPLAFMDPRIRTFFNHFFWLNFLNKKSANDFSQSDHHLLCRRNPISSDSDHQRRVQDRGVSGEYISVTFWRGAVAFWSFMNDIELESCLFRHKKSDHSAWMGSWIESRYLIVKFNYDSSFEMWVLVSSEKLLVVYGNQTNHTFRIANA